jgi:DNA-binding NarL/FixJ family response regulator
MLTEEGMVALSKALEGLKSGDAGGWTALAPLSNLAAEGHDITIDFTAQDKLGAPIIIARPKHAAMLPISLTPRQRQIATEVSRGLSNKEVAGLLGISPATVKDHMSAILAAVGLGSRAALIALMHGGNISR